MSARRRLASCPVNARRQRTRRVRARRGYTLLELGVVVALVAIAALLVTPQWWPDDPAPADTAEALGAMLDDARDQARSARQVVTVRIDAALGRFAIDTAGATGRGRWRDDALPDPAGGTLEPADARATFVFRPTGMVFGDSLRVRTPAGVVQVAVDAWTGEVRRAPR